MHPLPRHTRASTPILTGMVLAVLTVLTMTGCGTIAPDDPVAPSTNGSSTATTATGGPTTTSSAQSTESAEATEATESTDPQETDMGDECEYVQGGQAARPVTLPPMTGVPRTGKITYTISTNQGAVKITLDRARTPCTVNSFASLVSQGFYDGTRCHRLADNGLFMLQCGDPTGTGRGGPGYTIPDELTGDEVYAAGTVAMAKASQPNTGGSQFFLVYADSDLPPDYTVFGTIDETGLGVVNRIAAEGQDGSNPDGTGRPNNPAEIVKITKS